MIGDNKVLAEIEKHIAKDPSTLPLVPEGCLFCKEKWIGGCQVPGKHFPKTGLRVFYACGCSLSVWSDLGHGSVHLLAKNCNNKNGDCCETPKPGNTENSDQVGSEGLRGTNTQNNG